MLLAEKFGMEYTDVDGTKKTPYIIHRTSMGCYERTLALLIEKYAGALPTWMAPEQVRFLPVTDRAGDYCAEQARKLEDLGFRVEVDYRNEKIGKKDPRSADGQSTLYGGCGRSGYGKQHGFTSAPRRRRPGCYEHGGLYRPAEGRGGLQGEK